MSANFKCDAQGRRLSETIAGTTTAFAFACDNDNFMQELSVCRVSFVADRT
jgi:hypothetical protein